MSALIDRIQIDQIDAQLPQTQCGLCGHADGCRPYATAIVQQQQAANLCVPGGQPVADALAKLLQRPALTVAPSEWPLGDDGRPQRVVAVIREDECIGCTKCLDACPVDAIIGSGKLMHSILTDQCTGCELCIAPCPVDCIDLIATTTPSTAQQIELQNQLRVRHQHHVERQQHSANRAKRAPVLSPQAAAINAASTPPTPIMPPSSAAHMVQLATLRSQIGKLQKQLRVQPNNSAKQQQLAQLSQQLAVLEPTRADQA